MTTPDEIQQAADALFDKYRENGGAFLSEMSVGIQRLVRDAASRITTLEASLSAATARASELEREREEARDWVRRLTAESRVLTCVYCGRAYPPGSPEHGAEVLTEHIKSCERHPMRGLERECEAWRALAKGTYRIELAFLHVEDTNKWEAYCGNDSAEAATPQAAAIALATKLGLVKP